MIDIVRINPGSTEADVNLGSIQVFRLRFLQRIHIHLILRVALCHHGSGLELATNITGKVFVRCLPALLRPGSRGHGVPKDHASKLRFNVIIFARCAKKLCHKGQIHLAALPDGNGKRLTRRLHAGDAGLRTDRSLGEHIGLAFQCPVFIQVFQRAEQVIRRILVKGFRIGAGIDQAVSAGKAVICCIKLPLLCFDIRIGIIIQLVIDQLVHDLPQVQKPGHASFFLLRQLHMAHHRVFPEIYFSSHQCIGIVLHRRVSRDGIHHRRFILQGHLRLRDLPMDMGDGLCQLFGKLRTGDRIYRQCLLPVLRALRTDLAKHHFRMVNKIAVNGKPVLRQTQMHPVRLDVDGTVTLLQEDDV